MKCIHCQGEFAPKRKDSKYCSTKCRMAAKRNRDVTDKSLSVTKPVTDNESVTDKPLSVTHKRNAVTDKSQSVTDKPKPTVTDKPQPIMGTCDWCGNEWVKDEDDIKFNLQTCTVECATAKCDKARHEAMPGNAWKPNETHHNLQSLIK